MHSLYKPSSAGRQEESLYGVDKVGYLLSLPLTLTHSLSLPLPLTWCPFPERFGALLPPDLPCRVKHPVVGGLAGPGSHL